jgi:hypothetical protein
MRVHLPIEVSKKGICTNLLDPFTLDANEGRVGFFDLYTNRSSSASSECQAGFLSRKIDKLHYVAGC